MNGFIDPIEPIELTVQQVLQWFVHQEPKTQEKLFESLQELRPKILPGSRSTYPLKVLELDEMFEVTLAEFRARRGSAYALTDLVVDVNDKIKGIRHLGRKFDVSVESNVVMVRRVL